MSTTATAAVLRDRDEPFAVEAITLDGPRPGEVLVELVASGMCHTDLAIRDPGRPTPVPVVLGHEGAGVVVELGAGVTGLAVDDPVVLSYSSCGVCVRCAAGEPNYCATMGDRNFGARRPDGTTAIIDERGAAVGSHFFGQSSFATHAVVDARCAVRVGDDVDLALAGPLGCGLQTGAGAVLNTFGAPAGATLAVFGCGAVGLAAVMGAAAAGCSRIIGVDLHQNRLGLAEDLGATDVVVAGPDAAAEILALTSGTGVDFSFDACGAPGVLGQAVEVLAVRGTCGVVAAPGPEVTVPVSPRHLLFGRSVRGIIEGDAVPQVFIPRLLDLHRQGRFPYESLITTYPLAQINDAEAASERGEVVKPVLLV